MEISPVPAERIDEVMRIYDTFDRPPAVPISSQAARSALRRIRDQSGDVFVVMAGGSIVATYAIYICQNLTHGGQPFAVVENVICAPTHRRQRIGTAMMEHAKSYARNKGCFKITLQSGAGREPNRSFYERADSPATNGATRSASMHSIRYEIANIREPRDKSVVPIAYTGCTARRRSAARANP